MKKQFSSYALLLGVLLLGTLTSATAQKTYEWEHYKLQLTVPNDFRVKKNTDETFEMSGKGMELIMELVEEDITLDDLEEATIEGANEMELDEIDEATAVNSNGLKGYYVEGFKEGSRIMFAGMMDPRTKTNFFIAIIFDDEDKQAEKDALAILNSMKRMR
ncbi:amidohydrolase family protein [Telluribacter humicola]|uniref:hypothetical protein n=1 Tax=Telluribacter humicola TaxID=1720261 RepID=UPI001A968CF0|nr:hypothetical protein [Telluribacter humicola]